MEEYVVSVLRVEDRGSTFIQNVDTSVKICMPYLPEHFNFPVILAAFANLRTAIIASSYLSVRTHGTTRVPLDVFHKGGCISIFRKRICRKFKFL